MATLCLLQLAGSTAKAQSDEAVQLALNIEKLAQFKQILSDLKHGYEVVSRGYGTIKDISEGNFSLHKTFLDALMEVSPAVKRYKRVADIINCQIVLVKEYKAANGRFQASDCFNQGELTYIGRVYSNLFNQSLRNLDELTNVLTAGKLRMSDDERLTAIDRIYADMRDKLSFLRSFNNSNGLLAVQRMREKKDAVTLKGTYELNK